MLFLEGPFLVLANILASEPRLVGAPEQLAGRKNPKHRDELVKDKGRREHEDEHSLIECEDLALLVQKPRRVFAQAKTQSRCCFHLFQTRHVLGIIWITGRFDLKGHVFGVSAQPVERDADHCEEDGNHTGCLSIRGVTSGPEPKRDLHLIGQAIIVAAFG